MDLDGNGTISKSEFLSVQELAENPLLPRVIAIFDKNGDGNVDFQEFISLLSVFSSKSDKKTKFECLWIWSSSNLQKIVLFKVYDIDGDGYIGNGELFMVLKSMVGNNLNDTQLQEIVDKTILEADEDKDGKLSFEEFTKVFFNIVTPVNL